MRRWAIPLVILSCLTGLVTACFGRAMFAGEQFAYRDAGHYYYPLHERVQAEWNAGRWPLWEPEENSGMPLLGNPTAAVLYPGKVVFALFKYPLAARIYVIFHTLLAFAAMLALSRHWRLSWAGAALGALAYAFGGPVLFQYCNVIFLVGAAWLPLGFRAVDRWLRQGRRIALAELAVVLAMENLGGDPESAYLTGVCAASYAVGLAWRGRTFRLSFSAIGAILAAWVVATLAASHWAPSLRTAATANQPQGWFPWTPWVGPTVLAAWLLTGLILVARWRRASREGKRPVLVPLLFGLVVAAVLAAAISAAQLFPVLEFISQSSRASWDGAGNIYAFNLHPIRVIEFVWPNVFGTPYHGNRLWIGALPPKDSNVNQWVPTLYLGGLTFVLALGGLWRRGSVESAPWRTWIAGVATVSLLGSFGGQGSPIWLARLASDDRSFTGLDGGDGSVYWLLATGLPGFDHFRYPSKLLMFTVLGLSVLAAHGWDALATGDPRTRRSVTAWSGSFLLLTLAALGILFCVRDAFLKWLGTQRLTSWFGLFDAPGALFETQVSLLQSAVVLSATLFLALRLSGRRPTSAAVLALALTTGDLALANARQVVTVPQSLIDTTPEAASAILRAERENPSPGPYRVHRVPIWSPIHWSETEASNRVGDFVGWANQTLEPKYGINHGIEYTLTKGVGELYDYTWFFDGFHHAARERAARFLGVSRGTDLVAYPRRSFDMWNSRYFILPYSVRWDDANRGIASFVDRSVRIHPAPGAFEGVEGKAREDAWASEHDYQIRRNLDEFPRAWVVHDSRAFPAFRALSQEGRAVSMQEILFSNDLSWHDPARTVYDPRRYVWLEDSVRPELADYISGGYSSKTEAVRVVRRESDRVELEATLDRPGIVVLSDVYYPGWTLTIDSQPAPIYRANLMMRGSAVSAGRHTLLYRFRPGSFRLGLVVSGLGLAGLCLLIVRSAYPTEIRA
jgi:hypothetical protein